MCFVLFCCCLFCLLFLLVLSLHLFLLYLYVVVVVVVVFSFLFYFIDSAVLLMQIEAVYEKSYRVRYAILVNETDTRN